MSSVLCILLPRFPLVVASEGRRELLTQPLALAPEAGRTPVIGEVTPAAEALGVRRGLPLGEALSRCPGLRLLTPDPVGVQIRWDALLDRLEGIGAAVETDRTGSGGAGGEPGVAWLETHGIRRLHGGSLDGIVRAIRDALRMPARIGAAPTRFLALVAARRSRTRRPLVLSAADGLGPLHDESVETLGIWPEHAALAASLDRLGIGTFGAFLGLSRDTVGERFGPGGLRAYDLLRGQEPPLRPREQVGRIEAELRLPEAASGEHLRQALKLLVDQILADPQRRHRPLRSLLLQAALVERGTWQDRVVLREATADASRIVLALGLRIALLPAPAEQLLLRVDGLGSPVPGDRPLLEEDRTIRRARLLEAVEQVREVAGPEGALRVVEIDPGSRIPERRSALTPF